MLHCCGGTGYKKQPLQLERFLRDGKAGWVMGPTNEVLRQFVGKTALLGMSSLDYWNQVINQRAVDNELKKFTPEQKKELAERLLAEAGGNGASLRSPRFGCPAWQRRAPDRRDQPLRIRLKISSTSRATRSGIAASM